MIKNMSAGLKRQSLKDSLPMLLMVLSIVLLVVLQFFWLTTAWRETRDNFQKQTNSLFRQTIFAMHDSMVMRNIEPIRGDSVFRAKRFFVGDSLKTFFGQDTRPAHGRDTSSVVEVFISSSGNDSLRQMLKPLARRMRAERFHKKFLIRMGPDSLRRDSIRTEFAQALSASGISVPFTIHHIRSEMPGKFHALKNPPGTLMSELVPFNPLHFYSVLFEGTDRFFLKAITPQILFSLFVILVTAGSFYLMNSSIRSQKNLMKMKSDFISNISHELKTPVSTVSVALEALEKFNALDDREKTNEYLRMAQNELNRLVLMTDKILQTASYENKAPEMRTEIMDLDAGLKEVLESMKLVFENRKIEVCYEKQGGDFRMKGSRSHLVTVIYNLLDNAIKYSPEGSEITLLLKDDGNEITLSVKDQGMGIPAAYHKKVFEKFFRVPSGDVHNTKGYGLGLNYVWSIVEGHRGVIKLESELGAGSCFRIRFPKNGVA